MRVAWISNPAPLFTSRQMTSFHPPSQNTTAVRPWMNAKGGPPEARLAPWSTHHGRDESLRVRTYSTGQAKEGASADFAEEMKDATAVRRWRLHA